MSRHKITRELEQEAKDGYYDETYYDENDQYGYNNYGGGYDDYGDEYGDPLDYGAAQ